MPKPLEGRVAVVAGATGRGPGHCTNAGRGGRHCLLHRAQLAYRPGPASSHYAGRPETIEETADMVTAAGGTGIALRVDQLR